MRAILPAWTEPDPELHRRLGELIDPERRVLAAMERIVPLSGKRIADVGTGIGHYPMLLARRTARTYGIESDPELLRRGARACGRLAPAQHPHRGGRPASPAAARRCGRHRADRPDRAGRPLRAHSSTRRCASCAPNGRLIVIGYYGRDDVAGCSSRRSWRTRWRRPSDAPAGGCATASRSRSCTPARPARRCIGARAAAAAVRRSRPGVPDGATSADARLKLGLYHLARA